MEVNVMGVISDTHGLIRDEVKEFFKDCDLILHAGDVLNEKNILELEEICKVVVVRGNNDYMLPMTKFPTTQSIRINDSLDIFMIHDINDMNIDLESFDIVIHGHTHKPYKEYVGKTLVLNPGSFGPKRFALPISLVKINFKNDVEYDIVFHELKKSTSI